jgi:hypothetical protein
MNDQNVEKVRERIIIKCLKNAARELEKATSLRQDLFYPVAALWRQSPTPGFEYLLGWIVAELYAREALKGRPRQRYRWRRLRVEIHTQLMNMQKKCNVRSF